MIRHYLPVHKSFISNLGSKEAILLTVLVEHKNLSVEYGYTFKETPVLFECIEQHLNWNRSDVEQTLLSLKNKGAIILHDNNCLFEIERDKLKEIAEEDNISPVIPHFIKYYSSKTESIQKEEPQKEQKRGTGLPTPGITIKGVGKPVTKSAFVALYGLTDKQAYEIMAKHIQPTTIDIVLSEVFEARNADQIELLKKEIEELKQQISKPVKARKVKESKEPCPPENLMEVYRFAAEYHEKQIKSGDERYSVYDYLLAAEKGYNNYENSDPRWVDSNGKPVLNWKLKITKVFFNDIKKAPLLWKPKYTLESIQSGVESPDSFVTNKTIDVKDFQSMTGNELGKLAASNAVVGIAAKAYISRMAAYLEEDFQHFEAGQPKLDISRLRYENLAKAVEDRCEQIDINRFHFEYMKFLKTEEVEF